MPQRLVVIDSPTIPSKSAVGPGPHWACLAALLSLYIDSDQRIVGILDGLEGKSCVTAEGHPIAIDGTRDPFAPGYTSPVLLPHPETSSCSPLPRIPLCFVSCLLPTLLLSCPPPQLCFCGNNIIQHTRGCSLNLFSPIFCSKQR